LLLLLLYFIIINKIKNVINTYLINIEYFDFSLKFSSLNLLIHLILVSIYKKNNIFIYIEINYLINDFISIFILFYFIYLYLYIYID